MLRPFLSGAAISALVTMSLLGVSAHADNRTNLTNSISAEPSVPPVKLAVRTDSTTQALEKAVYQQINQYRASRKLPPLAIADALTQQARQHSQDMANGKVPFSHQGFDQRVREIAKSVSYRGAAENIAYNMGYKDPATQAVEGWLKSPGHLKNIQGTYGLTGIGVSRNAKGEIYFTQIFIRR